MIDDMKFWFDSRNGDGSSRDGSPADAEEAHFTVLIASNRKAVSDLFQAALGSMGYDASVCGNRWTVSMAVKRSPPSLAIIDWHLPKGTAEDMTRSIRERDEKNACIILAVAPDADPETLRRVFDAGSNDVVVDPDSEGEVNLRLRVCVHRALSAHTRQSHIEKLQAAHDRFLIASGGEFDGVWDWDVDSGKIDFSERWAHLLGLESEQLTDDIEEWFVRVHDDDREHLRHMVNAVIDGDIDNLEHAFRIRHQNGVYLQLLARGRAVRGKTGRASRLVGRVTNITDEDVFTRDAGASILLDPLTRLPSRTVLMDRLRQAFARARRKDGALFAVLFFDLDRFKNVNDGLGHLVGDKLLCAIAKRVQSICRPSDTVCRFGGDEFVLVAEDVEHIRHVTAIADRLQQEFLIPFDVEGTDVYASVSTGIAMWHPQYEKPEDLLRDADNAMYRAKASGRNRYAVFDEKMHAEVVATLALENDLRRAVARNEFRAFYQPIVILETGELAGFEALARWDHPERGLLLPGEFIQAAEEMGIATQIDRLVASEACRQLRAWQGQFRHVAPLTISVNVSTTQFLQPDLVSSVDQTLRENGLYGRSLKLEVTESVLMEHTEHASAMLDQLRTLDIGISIDDFGTGYSSLSYLRRFEIDTLKIDYSFVSRMTEDEDSSEIVRAITNLARNLSKETVAEGVETKSQLDKLREMKVDRVQGFFISRPVDADETTRLLEVIRLADNHLEAILADRLNRGAHETPRAERA